MSLIQGPGALRVETTAVINYLQKKVLRLIVKSDQHRVCSGMLYDIGDGLLGDAKNLRCNLVREGAGQSTFFNNEPQRG
jgi:hypothetical protein